MRSVTNTILWWSGAVAMVGVAVTLGHHMGNRLDVSVGLRDGGGRNCAPALAIGEGELTEWLFVNIGSSACGTSNSATLPAALDALMIDLQMLARDSGRGFTTHGVAVDWGVSDGVRHLIRIAAFDESSGGRSWLDSGDMSTFGVGWPERPVPHRSFWWSASFATVRETG